MPRATRKRFLLKSAFGGAETAPDAPEAEAPGDPEKRARREPRASHSWVDAVWGAAPGGLSRVASRDDAARDACSRGVLEVSKSGGRASATRLYHAYPLRLIVPRKAGVDDPGADCVWCYQVSFGGGLVAGDRAGASVDVADGCACVLATQGTNKVYKHAVRDSAKRSAVEPTRASVPSSRNAPKTSRETTQALAGRVGAGALLACLPDPTQAFRDARFRQTQRFVLHKTASLVSVDWLVSGRAAFRGGGAGGFVSARGGGVAPGEDATLTEGLERGERWRFASYRTNTEVFVDARDASDDGRDSGSDSGGFAEVCADACSLKGDRAGALARRMGDTHALATVILLGPRCAAAAARARESTRAAAAATVAGGARDVFANADEDATKEDKKAKEWLLVSSSPVPAPLGCDETEGGGIILRVAGRSTDAVYDTLRDALAPLAAELGAPPYAERGLS